jgi:glyoxylase-like metal-dependent hydrolase (beta-lactamase superfamily II)
MLIDVVPAGPILTNCYLATCEDTGKAVLVDPGWDDDRIREAIAARRAEVVLVVNTHAHWDHMGGNAVFVRDTGAKLAIHPLDVPLLEAKGGADLWNIPIRPSPAPDVLLEAGAVLEVGTLRFEVLFTPGHTPGHVSLYEAAHGVLFDGDVLFRQGIGRTDLPGGSTADLTRSIREVLYKLPDDTMVYPGHGEPTTIGEERQRNPWVPG